MGRPHARGVDRGGLATAQGLKKSLEQPQAKSPSGRSRADPATMATGEPHDKAGGYAIQGPVRHIVADPRPLFRRMGLPLFEPRSSAAGRRAHWSNRMSPKFSSCSSHGRVAVGRNGVSGKKCFFERASRRGSSSILQGPGIARSVSQACRPVQRASAWNARLSCMPSDILRLAHIETGIEPAARGGEHPRGLVSEQ